MGDCCRVARAAKSGALVPTHGDGSGTGTGGTVLFPDQPLDTWMGARGLVTVRMAPHIQLEGASDLAPHTPANYR